MILCKVYCIGENSLGTLGDGTTTARTGATSFDNYFQTKWVPVASEKTFLKIYGGINCMFAISTEGKLYSWGESNKIIRVSDANNPNSRPGLVPMQPNIIVTNICMPQNFWAESNTYMVVVDQNNQPYVLGTYNGETITTPYAIGLFKGMTITGCSFTNYVQIMTTDNGKILASGYNNYFQLMRGPGDSIRYWRDVVYP